MSDVSIHYTAVQTPVLERLKKYLISKVFGPAKRPDRQDLSGLSDQLLRDVGVEPHQMSPDSSAFDSQQAALDLELIMRGHK